MTYSFPDQNSVDASWQGSAVYAEPSINGIIAQFLYPNQGQISGIGIEGMKVKVYRRYSSGVDFSKVYESIISSGGFFSVTVPDVGYEYLVIGLSTETSRNSICLDWITST